MSCKAKGRQYSFRKEGIVVGDPKIFLKRIGAFDALTRVLFGLAVPVLQSSLYSSFIISELFTPKGIFFIVLSIFFGTLIEIAILFLVAKGYTVGMILKSLYNLYLSFLCLLVLRMVFLSLASMMYRPKVWVWLFLFVFCGLHLAFSTYFQFMAAFNKPVRAYILEIKRNRVRKRGD